MTGVLFWLRWQIRTFDCCLQDDQLAIVRFEIMDQLARSHWEAKKSRFGWVLGHLKCSGVKKQVGLSTDDERTCPFEIPSTSFEQSQQLLGSLRAASKTLEYSADPDFGVRDEFEHVSFTSHRVERGSIDCIYNLLIFFVFNFFVKTASFWITVSFGKLRNFIKLRIQSSFVRLMQWLWQRLFT